MNEMTDEELLRGNEIKLEIKSLSDKIEVLYAHKEGTKSTVFNDSEIKIHNNSSLVHDLFILNNSEVIDILDFLIERTRAKLKKLEEEFESL